jgi:DNA (cytosine-5)-methyltransferase 1
MRPAETNNVVETFPRAACQTPLGSFWGDKQKLTFIDLFCGIGGFHLAGQQLGMECIFAADIDEACRKVYKHNHGLEPVGDICRIDPKTIPDHDILCAGFPCQPFSIIGTGRGFADARGTLFFELAKIIKAKEPAAFVLENVRQLKTHNRGKTLARIVEILEDLGYAVHKEVLNALRFGLPQKRERILIVGFRRDISDVDNFDWPVGLVERIPLSAILEPDPDRRCFVSDRIRRKRRAAHTPKETPSIWHENKAGNISSHPFSCALRAAASYNYLLVNGERRLTPREMLRLQGFPDSFEFIGNDSQVRKQAGNSVPVPMVKAVLEKVMHVERSETSRAVQAA